MAIYETSLCENMFVFFVKKQPQKMNILAMGNESTFVAHRKYFHRPSQVLSFLAGISVKKLRKWRAVYFDKASSQSGSNNIVVFLTIQYYCLSLRHE